jgi:hypothetical protein
MAVFIYLSVSFVALGKYVPFLFCTVKLQIMIDDGADTKQKQLIKISVIHALS